jgi:L-ascorbate metabolism protein UlaG (beta-lactamase superfamily)
MKSKESKILLQWYGQSSFSITTATETVMIDPYFPLWRPDSEFIHRESPLAEETLKVDAVFVTHDHRDHNCPESQLRFFHKNNDLKIYGTKESVLRMLRSRLPSSQCKTLTAGQTVVLRDLSFHAVYAKPPEGDPGAGIPPPDVIHLGFVVETPKGNLYFSGDPINNFAENDELVNPVAKYKPEYAFITTHPDEGEFPFFDGAWKLAQKIGAQLVMPCHRECFVKRTYDPSLFSNIQPPSLHTLLIPYNTSMELFA